MRDSRTAASTAVARFPNDHHTIVELCDASDDFKELCEHYGECVSILADLRSADATDSQRLRDYEELTKELEQEIQLVVDASTKG